MGYILYGQIEFLKSEYGSLKLNKTNTVTVYKQAGAELCQAQSLFMLGMGYIEAHIGNTLDADVFPW